MEQEKQTETKPTENNSDGNKPGEISAVERANGAVKRLEEAEKRLDGKIAKLTELEVNRILGSTAGGRVEPTPPKVETPKEYADRVMNNKVK